MSRYTMNDYDIFWETSGGYWVAVRTGPDSVRRNIAPPNCATKREAAAAAREDRDDLNAEEAGQ